MSIAASVLALAGCGEQGGPPGAGQGAQPRPAGKPGYDRGHAAAFRRDDTNRDVVIDEREMQASVRRDFNAMDLDRDGVVTIEDVKKELRRQGRKDRTRRAGRLSDHLPYDVEDNGRITFDEYLAQIEEDVVRFMDADRDGRITPQEVEEYKKSRRAGQRPDEGSAVPFLLGLAGLRRRTVRAGRAAGARSWRPAGVSMLGVAGALALALLTAPSASASAFYNQTNQGASPTTFTVYLDCGIFCDNTWNIAPGDWNARPGKGGSFWIVYYQGDCETDPHPDVQDHGWGDINSPSQNNFQWAIFDWDQNPVGTYNISFGPPPPAHPWCT